MPTLANFRMNFARDTKNFSSSSSVSNPTRNWKLHVGDSGVKSKFGTFLASTKCAIKKESHGSRSTFLLTCQMMMFIEWFRRMYCGQNDCGVLGSRRRRWRVCVNVLRRWWWPERFYMGSAESFFFAGMNTCQDLFRALRWESLRFADLHNRTRPQRPIRARCQRKITHIATEICSILLFSFSFYHKNITKDPNLAKFSLTLLRKRAGDGEFDELWTRSPLKSLAHGIGI